VWPWISRVQPWSIKRCADRAGIGIHDRGRLFLHGFGAATAQVSTSARRSASGRARKARCHSGARTMRRNSW
jgi:hypothetical protein